MIEFDIITYLTADSTLDTLLTTSSTDTKIYPIQAPIGAQDKLPYIIYSINQSGTFEENLLEESITFDCVSGTYLEAKNVKDRLIKLLDLQDQAQNNITSALYRIYWSKFTAGVSYVDSDNKLFHNIVTIDFKYNEQASREVNVRDKVLAIPISFGSLQANKIVLSNFTFDVTRVVNKVALGFTQAPEGCDLTYDLTKNDTLQSIGASVTDGEVFEKTTLTDGITYTSSDTLGCKILTVGSTFAGAGVTLFLYYQ